MARSCRAASSALSRDGGCAVSARRSCVLMTGFRWLIMYNSPTCRPVGAFLRHQVRRGRWRNDFQVLCGHCAVSARGIDADRVDLNAMFLRARHDLRRRVEAPRLRVDERPAEYIQMLACQ